MAVTADAVVVEIEAKVAKAQADIRQYGKTFDDTMSQTEQAATQAEVRINSSADRIAARRERLAGQIKRSTDMEIISALRGAAAVETNARRVAAAQQNIGRQIADIGVQLSAGTSPLIVLSQQLPQIADAAGQAEGRFAKLARFLSSPFGAAIVAGASILGVLIGELIKASDEAKVLEDNLKRAADGSDAFGDAQSLLGKLVDLTTGKLKSQNEVLRASIRLQALLTKQQAQNERDAASKAIKALGDARSSQPFGGTYMGPGTVGGGAITLDSPELQSISNRVRAGSLGADAAIKELETLTKRANISKEAVRNLQTQVLEFAQAGEKVAASQTILDFLDSGKLDPRLRQDGTARKKRERADRSDQREERFNDLLAQEQDAQLALQQQLTSDVREQARIEHERIDRETAAFSEDLRHAVTQKELTAERARQLEIERARTAELEHSRVNFRLDDQLTEQELDLRQSEINNRTELLRGELDLARTEGERRRIQHEILDASFDLLRASLEAVKAKHKTTDIEYQIADARLKQLDQERAQAGARADRDTQGPLERYLDQIPKDADELNESMERVAVDGLEALNEGITDAIMNAESLGDVFGRIADQIIADLLRIAIQQAIVKPLGEALFGGGSTGIGGGGGGLIGGLISGIGAIFGRASGGYVGPGQTVRVNEHKGGVELLRMGSQGGQVIPLGQTRAAQPAAQRSVVEVRVEGSRMFEPTVRRISGNAAVEVLRAGAPAIVAEATRSTLQAVPSRMAQFGNDGV